MAEEIEVYHSDMETYLKPEEYRAFLKAKEEVEEYGSRRAEYEKKKEHAEWLADEYRTKKDEAESEFARDFLETKAMLSELEASMSPPYKPTHYFHEHDRHIDLVKERKLKELQEEERGEAEKEAERQREEERKQREQQMMVTAMRRNMAADAEWQQFQTTFNSAIKELKHQLANPKLPKFALGCSSEVLNYRPELWGEIDLPSDDEVRAWVKPQILEKIPEVLRPFITWGFAPQIWVVPKAEYQLIGVPCLVWHFDIYVAAKVNLWLKESTISGEFHGLKYFAPVKAGKIGSFFLKAQFWGSQEGLEIPIALVALLVEGKLEAPGMTIEFTMSDPVSTIYTVAGFEERRLEYYYITVQEEFRRFIGDTAKDQSLAQGLLGKGLVDEVIANLIEAKWNEPLPVSSKAGDAGGSDLKNVVAKLVELGWTEADAKKAVETTTFPNNATTEKMVGIMLEKSY